MIIWPLIMLFNQNMAHSNTDNIYLDNNRYRYADSYFLIFITNISYLVLSKFVCTPIYLMILVLSISFHASHFMHIALNILFCFYNHYFLFSSFHASHPLQLSICLLFHLFSSLHFFLCIWFHEYCTLYFILF